MALSLFNFRLNKIQIRCLRLDTSNGLPSRALIFVFTFCESHPGISGEVSSARRQDSLCSYALSKKRNFQKYVVMRLFFVAGDEMMLTLPISVDVAIVSTTVTVGCAADGRRDSRKPD